jgi:hypothetical protein
MFCFMGNFANALMSDARRPSLVLYWLAGLLEAEGTFLKPAPSNPHTSRAAKLGRLDLP